MRPIGPATLLESAINFVSYRLRSRSEIEAYLVKTAKRKGFSSVDIGRALARMEELGYINDEKFAEAFVSTRMKIHPKGRRGLEQELKAKGIVKEIASRVLDRLYADSDSDGVDEYDVALKALGRRLELWKNLPSPDRWKKVSGFLLRRGFGLDIVSRIVDSPPQTD